MALVLMKQLIIFNFRKIMKEYKMYLFRITIGGMKEIEYGSIWYEDILNADVLLDKNVGFMGRDKFRNIFFPEDTNFSPLLPKILSDFGHKEGIGRKDLYSSCGRHPRGLTHTISIKLKKILESFNLAPHRFYKAEVLFGGDLVDYNLFHLVDGVFGEYFIDYEKCLIQKKGVKIKESDLKVISVKSRKEISEKVKNIGWRTWEFKKIALKANFFEFDMVAMPRVGIVISERLKNALEEANLIGLKLVECPVEFVIAED